MLLGVDVGGTFTDAVLAASGRVVTAKAPTTPDDQSRGVLAAVAAVLDAADAAPSDVRAFAHGMTVATNALLEGDHARTAFVATAGFTDLVELARQNRPELYRLCAARPAPIAPPELRFGAAERMGPREVLEPLTDAAATRVADALARAAPEAVAVCLLHSWRDPGARAGDRRGDPRAPGRRGPRLALTRGRRDVPRVRACRHDGGRRGAVAPARRLSARLGERTAAGGLPDAQIMQSSGGLVDAGTAARHAVLTVLSGPAGGAAAAALVGAALR